jgi:hypothetical protein
MVNTVRNPGQFGGTRVLVEGERGYSAAWGGGPWNEWKMMDGSTATPWKTCSAEYLGAVATTRVVILPLGLTIAVLLSLFLLWRATGMNPVMVAIPAILLIICAIFLFYSIFWPTAIVISLAALFGMGAGHKGGNAFIVALVIEFFALAVVCGGLGLGAFFYSNNTPFLWFDLGAGGSAHSNTWGTLASCSTYYDYFRIDNNNRPYDVENTLTYKNYCSEGWYAYLGLVADFVVSLQIIMLATTGVAYLRGSGAKAA